MSTEFMVWVLTGAVGVISILIGTLWSMIRSEKVAQDEVIKQKADKDVVTDTEIRLAKELEKVRAENEKMGARLESRADRDSANMELRIQTRMDVLERNLLRQLELMMEALKGRD